MCSKFSFLFRQRYFRAIWGVLLFFAKQFSIVTQLQNYGDFFRKMQMISHRLLTTLSCLFQCSLPFLISNLSILSDSICRKKSRSAVLLKKKIFFCSTSLRWTENSGRGLALKKATLSQYSISKKGFIIAGKNSQLNKQKKKYLFNHNSVWSPIIRKPGYFQNSAQNNPMIIFAKKETISHSHMKLHKQIHLTSCLMAKIIVMHLLIFL